MNLAPDAVCVGDNCVDFYLPPINCRYIGGNALNTSVYLRRRSISTAYVGVVGDDGDGEMTLAKLRQEDVDVSHVAVLRGKTATSHILLKEAGERQFVYEYLGPRPVLDLDEATMQFICRHRLIHTTWAGGTKNYLRLFTEAAGAKVSLDYGERFEAEFLKDTIGYVDWAFFSMSPGQRKQAEDFAVNAFDQGPRLVVVTLGPSGSLAYDGALTYQPAVTVRAIDTLGAGDAYIGTFLAARLSGSDLPHAMQEASRVAAQTCTHFGGWMQTPNPPATEL